MIKAEIIADSMSQQGHRLTTFICVFPRIVLAEFNTHRMLSRNSASSRAIPFEKMLKLVEREPFIPIKWMKEHKGMQGTEYFEDEDVIEYLKLDWLNARDAAVNQARELSERGLTKQIVNRLLEPFMWHTVIVTASEWSNFFALRAHPDAEIHIQDLAYKMLEEYNKSTPKLLQEGDWHIPFGDKFDFDRLITLCDKLGAKPGDKEKRKEVRIKISTARCARVSYMNFEGKDDYEADITLHDRLLQSGHMSPFEHCARVMSEIDYDTYGATPGTINNDGSTKLEFGWCGNFRGFIQYRKMLKGENKIDKRIKPFSV